MRQSGNKNIAATNQSNFTITDRVSVLFFFFFFVPFYPSLFFFFRRMWECLFIVIDWGIVLLYFSHLYLFNFFCFHLLLFRSAIAAVHFQFNLFRFIRSFDSVTFLKIVVWWCIYMGKRYIYVHREQKKKQVIGVVVVAIVVWKERVTFLFFFFFISLDCRLKKKRKTRRTEPIISFASIEFCSLFVLVTLVYLHWMYGTIICMVLWIFFARKWY